MSLTAIIAALGGLTGVVGLITYIFKFSSWALSKTPAQKEAAIDTSVQDAEKASEQDGIPR